MEDSERRVTVRLTPKQSFAFDLLTNDQDASVLYGGAKGGGKDFLFCVWVKVWVERLIKLFGLTPSKNPLALGFVGRKRGVDFKDTTLEEFKRIIPADHYRLHDNEHEIIFHETAKVFCGGLDDPERVEKFNSANYAFFAINQAEEMERKEVGALRAALRVKFNGIRPPYKELYTANPADCWLKHDFIDAKPPIKNHFFVPALYTDNPHLPENYRDILETSFKYNPAILKAYRDGDWTALQSTNTLITDVLLNNLKGVRLYFKDIRRIVACDPSLGGDACVIQVIENGKILEQLELHERDPMKIAGQNLVMGNKWGCPNFAIDYSGGLGEAIAARIREVNRAARVRSVNSAENASDPDKADNVRAEMWWNAWNLIREKQIPYPEDEELRRQLTAVRFKVGNSSGCVKLEPKDDTKKRLQRSPDNADAFVIGLYELYKTEPIVKKDAWDMNEASREVRSAVTSAMAA